MAQRKCILLCFAGASLDRVSSQFGIEIGMTSEKLIDLHSHVMLRQVLFRTQDIFVASRADRSHKPGKSREKQRRGAYRAIGQEEAR